MWQYYDDGLWCSELWCEVEMNAVLTTVRTSPGFWIRWAFTTWKTSTTLSLLQRSMVVAMAQNIPDLLTVSLKEEWLKSHTITRACSGYWPAVDHNGFVLSPTLHLVHLFHHSNDGLWVGTLATTIPVPYLKLSNPLRLARLYRCEWTAFY